MGMRFRKSIKVAPGVKINLNKNSISTTVGAKGAHYTINSNGNKTATAGIPGTGVSYSTTSSSKATKKEKKNNSSKSNDINTNGPNKKKKGKGCLTLIIVFIIMGAIGSLMDSNKPTKLTISADTKTVHDVSEAIPITIKADPSDAKLDDLKVEASGGNITDSNGKLSFTASDAGKYKVYVTCDDVTSNTLSFTIENKKELEERKAQEQLEAERIAAEQAEEEQEKTENADAQAQSQPQEPMVWIPQSGSKYHKKSDCGNMDPNTATQVTKSEAEARNYTPCGRCY